MSSTVSKDTHKQYKLYSIQEAMKIYEFIGELRKGAEEGKSTPYHPKAFIKHTRVNQYAIQPLLNGKDSNVAIPASILFWIYRSCISLSMRCPVEIPHVCKLPDTKGELFFVTTKEEWQIHRNTVLPNTPEISITPHAKLNYLSRVLGMPIESSLSSFPYTELSRSKGKILNDGRVEHIIGDHVYLMDGNVCVTVLSKGMVTK